MLRWNSVTDNYTLSRWGGVHPVRVRPASEIRLVRVGTNRTPDVDRPIDTPKETHYNQPIQLHFQREIQK